MKQTEGVGGTYTPGSLILVGCGLYFGATFINTFTLSLLQNTLIIVLLYVGIIVGAAIGGFLLNRIGRKKIIFISAAALILAGVLTVIHIQDWLILRDMNRSARFFAGLSFGIAYVTQIILISETSSIKSRGKHLTNISASVFAGCLIHYIYSSFFINSSLSTGIASILFGIIGACSVFRMKESPYFTLRQGNEALARDDLMFMRKCHIISFEITEEINEMKADILEGDQIKHVNELFMKNGQAFMSSIFLMFLQTVAFNPIIMSLHLFLIGATFLTSIDTVYWPFILLGCARFVASIITMYNIDKTGRKKWLLISATGSAVCFVIIPVIMFRDTNIVIIGSAELYATCFFTLLLEFFIGLGIGIIPDVILGEALTPSVKPLGTALSTIFAAVLNIIYVYVFTEGITFKKYGSAYYWSIYCSSAVFLIGGSIFTHFSLPETSHKSLRQVRQDFGVH